MFPSRQKILLLFGVPSDHFMEALRYPLEFAPPPFLPRNPPEKRRIFVLPGAHHSHLPPADEMARFVLAFPKSRLLFLAAVPCRRTVLRVVNTHRIVLGFPAFDEDKIGDDFLSIAMRGTVAVVKGDRLPPERKFETSTYNVLYPYPEPLIDEDGLLPQPALFTVYPVAVPKIPRFPTCREVELQWLNAQGNGSPKLERLVKLFRGDSVLVTHYTPPNDVAALLERCGLLPLGRPGPGPFFTTDVERSGDNVVTVLAPDQVRMSPAIRHVFVLDPPPDVAYLLWHFPNANVTLFTGFHGPGQQEAVDLFLYREMESAFVRTLRLIHFNSLVFEAPSHTADPYLLRTEENMKKCPLLQWGLDLFKLYPVVSYEELTQHLELVEGTLRRETFKLVVDHFSCDVVEDLNGVLGKIVQSEHCFRWEPI